MVNPESHPKRSIRLRRGVRDVLAFERVKNHISRLQPYGTVGYATSYTKDLGAGSDGYGQQLKS